MGDSTQPAAYGHDQPDGCWKVEKVLQQISEGCERGNTSPDNDDIGKKHAEDIAEGMIDVAHSIKIVELPDLEEHEDITDWITKRSGTKEKLLQLVVETPQYKKTFRRICLTLGKSDKNSLPANAAKACEAINKLGVYYWKSGMPKNGLGEILFDHNGVPTFHLMSKDDVFNAISKVAYSNENKKGLPPKEIASYVYEMPADGDAL